MLDPRDEALIAALVTRRLLSPEQGEQFRRTFRGPAGALGAGLVQVGALSGPQLEAVWLELSAVAQGRPFASPVPPSQSGAYFQPPSATPGSGFFPGQAQTPPSSHFPGPAATPGSGYHSPAGAFLGQGTPQTGWRVGSAPTPATRPPEPGQQSSRDKRPAIPGLKILSELGRGGMGAVYKGVVEESGRAVAIKVLLDVSERRVKRFEREAQAMSRLRHPYIVELVATGLDNHGQPYLAMDYVTGGDLAGLKEEGVGVQRVLEIMFKVARAIEHAHGEGILHRDLKPANVLLDAAGEPRVTDFGLAKILDRETQLTQENAVLGTPFYMAPEQVRGEGMSEQTDVYALGVVLYELLTGEYPCVGENRIELYQQIQNDVPLDPRKHVAELPEVLSALILWSLEKDPGRRPTCRELGDVLEDLAQARPPRVLPPALRRPGLRKAVRAALALATLGLVVALVLAGLGLRELAREEARAEAALAELRESVREARGVRAGRELTPILAEVEALREVSELLARLPQSVGPAGEELAALGLERRPVALREGITLLLEAQRTSEAAVLARELAGLLDEASGDRLLAEVLSCDERAAAEAYAAVTRIRTRGPRPDDLAPLAEALLRLARPRQAAEVLAEAPPELVVLRARAWREAGELQRAEADLSSAETSRRDPLALPIERALVAGALGRAEAALTNLDKLRGGSDPRWHAARGELLELLERPAGAQAAYAQAAKLGSVLPREARLLLRSGFRIEAVARLARLEAQLVGQAQLGSQAKLDAALAAWLGGGPDQELRAALEEVMSSVAGFSVSPSLGVSAAGWLALLEASRGPQGYLAAASALERGQAWVEGDAAPGPSLALIRAWLLAQSGHLEHGLRALPQAERAQGARAAFELEWGGSPAAPERALTSVYGAAWLARARLSAAKQQPPRERARLATLFHAALKRPGPGGRPIGVPLGSELGLDARPLLAARLVLEASNLFAATHGRVLLGEAGPQRERRIKEGRARLSAAEAQVKLLLARACALNPHDVHARLLLALAEADGAAVEALIADCPDLDELRRVRLKLAVKPLEGEALRRALVNELAPHLEALAASPNLSAADALLCVRGARLAGDPQRAWELLQPALAAPHRERELYREALALAQELGRPELTQIQRAVAEIEESYRMAPQLYADADTGEASINDKVAPALKRIARDLPLTSSYYRTLATSLVGEGAWAPANLAGGKYAATIADPSTSGFALWLYAFGWAKEAPQNLVFELGASASEAAPLDPSPHLGQALFLGSRYYLSPAAEKDPEDLWRALNFVRKALELEPECFGAICLAYSFCITARLEAEAASYLQRGRALNPASRLLSFHEARALAMNGDWQGALAIHKDLVLSTASRRLLSEDPSYEPIRGRKEWADYVASLSK